MPREDRILSQSEIDFLLKRILPKTDKPDAKDEPASVEPTELPVKPENNTPDTPSVASIKAKEQLELKAEVLPDQTKESIKMNEYKTKMVETTPSTRPAETVKREQTSDEGEGADLQKKIADLTGEVSKLTAAMQKITQLEEKVRQLESVIKLMPDSNKTLKGRVDEISDILAILQEKQSDHTFLEGFKCNHCGSKGLVAVYIKCTSCGKENWMGWWPDEKPSK